MIALFSMSNVTYQAPEHDYGLRAGRDRALGRLLDYYHHTATLAQARIARQTRPGASPAAQPDQAAAPTFADARQALAWARADRDNLLACLNYVTAADQSARVIALTAGLGALMRRDGPWADAVIRHATAARAARLIDDRLSEANALIDLGDVLRVTGDCQRASQVLEEALSIYRDLGDRLGEANALDGLGVVQWVTDDYQGAARTLEEALSIYRDLGDRLGEANALNELGCVQRTIGDYKGAASVFAEALSRHRHLGDRLGQATAHRDLGIVRRLTGDYVGSADAVTEALAIHRDVGDRLGEANALSDLGVLRLKTGDYPGAARLLQEALGMCQQLGDWLGEANALNDLGTAHRLTGDYQGASRAHDAARRSYAKFGSRLGEANALTCIGIVRRLTKDWPGAARALDAALTIFRDLGDRGGEATALNERGTAHLLGGESAEAKAEAQAYHLQALELAVAIGSAWDEAHALVGLARCAAGIGDALQARALLQQAQEIFRRIGAADASAVLAELELMTAAMTGNSDLGRSDS